MAAVARERVRVAVRSERRLLHSLVCIVGDCRLWEITKATLAYYHTLPIPNYQKYCARVSNGKRYCKTICLPPPVITVEAEQTGSAVR